MFYSLLVLQPRSRRYFRSVPEFEEFMAVLAAGARYQVLAAVAFIGVTGLFLAVANLSDGMSLGWKVCVVAKVALLLIALAIFSYASWVLWPARVLSSPGNVADCQRKFRTVGWILLVLAGLNTALGIVARYLR
jgi:hypothetical protein